MAWLGIIIYEDMQGLAIYRAWIRFYPTTLYPREKSFGQRWDQTRLASSASKYAIHYAITSRAF